MIEEDELKDELEIIHLSIYLYVFLSRSSMIQEDEYKDELEIIHLSIYLSFYLGRLVW